MAFPTQRTETLNSLVTTVLRQKDDKPNDVVTTRKPLWKMMRQKNGGLIETRSPNIKGFPIRLMYRTEANIQTLSASLDMQSQDRTQPDPYTEAWYYWLQDLVYLSLGKFHRDNTRDAETLVNYVRSLKRAIEVKFDSMQNQRFFYGHKAGTDVVFGLNDYIQIAPGTAPDKGDIGDIDVSASGASFWQNKVANFNDNYKVINTERTTSNLAAGDTNGNDLLGLWLAVSQGDEFGEGPQTDASRDSNNPSEPDFLLCNEELYRAIADLADERLLFVNQESDYQLGGNTYWFRSARVLYEPTMPTYTATYGNGWFVNTNAVGFVKAEGLTEDWGDAEQIPGITGYQWPYGCQYSTYCNDRQKLGVIYNVKPALDNT